MFGKVRYMNYAACKSKFKIAQYVERIENEVREELAAARRGRRGGGAAQGRKPPIGSWRRGRRGGGAAQGRRQPIVYEAGAFY